PGNPTITSPGNSSTTVTGLMEGTFIFRLSVQDNNIPIAALATDDVTITVNPVQNGNWQTLSPISGTIIAREENAYVKAGNKFYLIGGRGIVPVQEYNPINKTWTNKANVPVELNHFQAVTLNGLVYVSGAFTGQYPHEIPVSQGYIYNSLTDKWYAGAQLPTARLRGSAGAVVYQSKIYLVGGIVDGHWNGWVKWFDEYDPATNTWRTLPDAPRVRDHFHAAVINGKLYVASGRRSSASTGEVFNLTVAEVDVYDFTTGLWSTLPAGSNLPIPRAGATTSVLNNELLIIGGESPQPAAHGETHALNLQTNIWRRLPDLVQGRHGTQVIESNSGLYISSGAGNQGGSNLLTSQEVYYPGAPTTPNDPVLTQSQLTAVSSVNFGSVPVNTETSRTVTLTNTTGNQDIVISSINLSGATTFTYTSPYTLPFVLQVGQSADVTVKFKPVTSAPQTASLVINHSGQTLSNTTALSGQGGGALSSYKVNGGGSQQTTSLGVFSADVNFAPSPGNTFSIATSINILNTTDDAIYRSERYGTNGVLSYAFPVVNGTYTVRLHFSENYHAAVGRRIFDITMEGVKVKDNFDVFAKAGAAFTATTETFQVNVTDGVLNINFSSLAADGGVDQPKVSAIEIFDVTAAQSANTSVGSNSISGETMQKLSVKTLENPTDHQFTLKISSGSAKPVTLSIYNTVGQLLEARNNVSPGGVQLFGLSYRPGLYYAEIRQGNEKVIMKLIKQ
ncbi:MAG: malectin domain-containing carbohydrate-binding protein, partial [Chitinophagaceae bacterium]